MTSDSDPFARWEAGQKRMVSILVELVNTVGRADDLRLAEPFVDAMRKVVNSEDQDLAFLAEMLTLPAENYLGEFVVPIDPIAIHRARRFMKTALAIQLEPEFCHRYRECHDDGPYELSSEAIGRRTMKNICLDYLVQLEKEEYYELAGKQYRDAHNMTDAIAALSSLVSSSCPVRVEMLGDFYGRWKDDPLVVDKWLTLQACSDHGEVLQRVQELCRHEAFNIRNPNKVRALIGAFAQANPGRFHESSGNGYRFLADRIIELDPINPQIASRLMGNFNRWRSYEPDRSVLMREQVERILAVPELSADVSEIATKALSG
jgi:aminopeptidase N